MIPKAMPKRQKGARRIPPKRRAMPPCASLFADSVRKARNRKESKPIEKQAMLKKGFRGCVVFIWGLKEVSRLINLSPTNHT